MASNNVVDLIIDIKLEGKKELKTYTKELKDLVKVLNSLDKKTFSNVNKVIKEQEKALKGASKASSSLAKENTKLAKEVDKSTKANTKLNDSLKNQEKNASQSSFALNKVSLAVAAGVGGVIAWTNATVQANIELEQQARLAGLSVQEFEKWAFAAKTVGVSADQMADAFNEIGLKSQDALQEGSGGFFDQLNKLNIDIKEFTQLDPAAQFEALGEALAGLNEAEQKFALDEIASDAGIQTQAVLENIVEMKQRIKEVQELGGFVSPEQRSEISELNKELVTFTQLLSATSTKAFSAFAPVMEEFILDLQEMLSLINKANEGELSDLASGMIRVSAAVSLVKNSLGLLSDVFETVLIEGEATFSKLVASIQLKIKQLTNIFQNLPELILAGFSGASIGIIKFFEDIAFDVLDIYETLFSKVGIDIDFDTIRSQIQSLSDISVATVTIDDTSTLNAVKEYEEEKLRIQKEYDAKRALIEANRAVKQDQQAQETIKNLEDVASAASAVFDPQFAAQTDDRFKSQLSKPIEEEVEKAKVVATRGFSEIAKEIAAEQAKLEKLTFEFKIGLVGEEEFRNQAENLTNTISDLFIEQSKLTKNEEQRVVAEKESLKVRNDLVDLLKTESNLTISERKAKEDILKAEIELAKAKGDNVSVIEKSLELTKLEIESNKDITSDVKAQQIALAEKQATQEKLNLQKKEEEALAKQIKKDNEEAAALAEKELENRKQGLAEIRSLQLELLEIQGKRTELDKIETQREAAIGAIDPTLDKDLQVKQKDLINKIFDEKAVKAQFQTILDEYLDLLEQFQNAESGAEAALIREEIEAKQASIDEQIATANPDQIREMNQATQEWNESLTITDNTMKTIANSLASGLVDGFMAVINGTKSVEDAFKDMAYNILQQLLEIQLQMLAMQALGLNDQGGFTGEGLFGLFGAGGGGGSILQFHEGGGINDAMVQTRSLDQSLRADEMPAVIKKTETVVSNNKLNQMKASGNSNNISLNNNLVLDPADVVTNAAKTDAWNENLISFIKSNSNEIKQIIS